MSSDFDYYFDLYENISLEEYLKDKSVEDIVETCGWLERINNPVLLPQARNAVIFPTQSIRTITNML
jgi:hypothetical protein